MFLINHRVSGSQVPASRAPPAPMPSLCGCCFVFLPRSPAVQSPAALLSCNCKGQKENAHHVAPGLKVPVPRPWPGRGQVPHKGTTGCPRRAERSLQKPHFGELWEDAPFFLSLPWLRCRPWTECGGQGSMRGPQPGLCRGRWNRRSAPTRSQAAPRMPSLPRLWGAGRRGLQGVDPYF